ncbi:MAG: endonuclease/exonuclease/phosphatase family protein [Myxococcales bacterium]|nr:endonuclease/exonuclease/phosphatase family protein [Myxococcales bacterium]MCB9521639.1 endonuclease/exonuclease/phosphatase family protein [Myxococcales bacterium]MCB9531603.1 endonuclease/exonuclease/phosphatase family protein [Myxococcales bacterium]MCB9532745.1 endonuclease/exonuclease/phosphatase family protein [Myxococcales bacterium]
MRPRKRSRTDTCTSTATTITELRRLVAAAGVGVLTLAAGCRPDRGAAAPIVAAPVSPASGPDVRSVAPAANLSGEETPDPVQFIAWNINAGTGENDQQLPFISEVLRGLSEIELVALVEAEPGWLSQLENAADASGRDFGLATGEHGCDLRIALLFAADRWEWLGTEEVTGVAQSRCARAPLAVSLRDRQSGDALEVVVAHLYRGRGDEGERRRAEEADALAAALSRTTRPVLLLGDLNADCPTATAPRGCAAAFDALIDGGLRWHEPVPRSETTCRHDMTDMLDLVFSARLPDGWAVTTSVVHESMFCEQMARGAHYPIRGELTFGSPLDDEAER